VCVEIDGQVEGVRKASPVERPSMAVKTHSALRAVSIRPESDLSGRCDRDCGANALHLPSIVANAKRGSGKGGYRHSSSLRTSFNITGCEL
jgi:hypothetical protein